MARFPSVFDPFSWSHAFEYDVSATAFYQPGSVVQIVAHLLGKHSAADLRIPLVDKDRSRLEKSLKGIKIVIKHRGPVRRKYRIVCFTSTPASRTTFSKNNTGVEQTVAEYFLEKYICHSSLHIFHVL
ncbi:hypothetical protein BASA83_003089 [Batrachochytrium salamandrivorans]|nr:hypothetical protein BASA83_003089 [Batrachochytrium salamandrivorans]